MTRASPIAALHPGARRSCVGGMTDGPATSAVRRAAHARPGRRRPDSLRTKGSVSVTAPTTTPNTTTPMPTTLQTTAARVPADPALTWAPAALRTPAPRAPERPAEARAELERLLAILPAPVRHGLDRLGALDDLLEVVLDLGRVPA